VGVFIGSLTCIQCKLVIDKANYSHAGVYTCRALNRISIVESNMTVLVGGKSDYTTVLFVMILPYLFNW